MEKCLPDTVAIGGKHFRVETDFRVWMRFCNEFEKWNKKADMDVSYLFLEEVPEIYTSEDMEEVLRFAYPITVIPKSNGGSSRIIDYEIDSDYIYSAFLGQYGIDLMEKDMHWHIFCALLNGLNNMTKLYEIMGYRCYTGNDKDYIKLRNAWELPVELTDENRKAKQEFDDYFN